MKDLLSKEHCCYKIYTLIVRSAYPPPFYDRPPRWITPSFLQENLEPTSLCDFSKILTPLPLSKICHTRENSVVKSS